MSRKNERARWVVIDANTQTFRCERCKAESPMPNNILVNDFVKIGDQFKEKHLDCKERKP